MTAMDRRGILAAIVWFSIRFHGVIIAVACLLMAYGIYSLPTAKSDVFPEFAPPRVKIQTESPGLAPEQVETLVTTPIENAIVGVPGIESVYSSSIQGLSLIKLTFHWASNIYLDRQLVTEQLSTLTGKLPRGVKAPVMTPLTSSTAVVLVFGLTSETRTPMDVMTIGEWTVKPALLSVPGVANVVVYGRDLKQLQIQFRPESLIKYNLSIADLSNAAMKATGVRGAGFVENENQRITLRSRGQSLTAEELGKVVVAYRDGAAVRLENITTVAEAPAPPVGAATVMGKQGVQVMVLAQYGANTLEVTDRLETALAELKPALDHQGLRLYPDLFRPANFIDTALHNVKSSLLIGAVLVVAILLLFLFDLKTAAISCAAIPLSLLAAIEVMQYFGLSLNTMTLGGLAISIGIVVDDAIIDVENILRRLRESRESADGTPVSLIIFHACLEVRSPVIYATLAVALVVVPVLTISGVAGHLFASLGIAFILATLASLVVALTVTPALAILLLSGRIKREEPPVPKWLKKGYGCLLRRIERRPTWVIVGVVIFAVLALLPLAFLPSSFLPQFREGHFVLHMELVPGTSLQESLRLGREVTAELLKNPYVRSVTQRAGRAPKAKDVMGPQSSEFEVSLKTLRADESELASAKIRKSLQRFFGATFTINTFLTERMEEVESGYTFPVVVNIFGNDLDVLSKKGQEVAKVMREVPGATDVALQAAPGTPQLTIRLRKDDLIKWGFDPVSALDAIHSAYEGKTVGQIYQGNRIFDVSVILRPDERKTIADAGDLPLRNSVGTYVRLKQLADVYESAGRYNILHEGARRVEAVTCNVTGRTVESFVREARKKIGQKVKFPAGTYVEFAGTAKAEARARSDLLVHSMLVAVAIVLMLSLAVKRARNLFLVLVNLPFALAGGVLAATIYGGPLQLGSMVGFVTLFGITVRNAILMISHYEHLVYEENMAWGAETAVKGASERLTPILMTALVTALGLLPLAIGTAPGQEIEGPMAIVILGGLFTSTVLNLLVLPALALRYGRFEKSPAEI